MQPLAAEREAMELRPTPSRLSFSKAVLQGQLSPPLALLIVLHPQRRSGRVECLPNPGMLWSLLTAALDASAKKARSLLGGHTLPDLLHQVLQSACRPLALLINSHTPHRWDVFYILGCSTSSHLVCNPFKLLKSKPRIVGPATLEGGKGRPNACTVEAALCCETPAG